MRDRIYRMPKVGEHYKVDGSIKGNLMFRAEGNKCVDLSTGVIGGLFSPEGTRYICNADGTPKTRPPKPLPGEAWLEQQGKYIKILGLFTDAELLRLARGITEYLEAVEAWEAECES